MGMCYQNCHANDGQEEKCKCRCSLERMCDNDAHSCAGAGLEPDWRLLGLVRQPFLPPHWHGQHVVRNARCRALQSMLSHGLSS